MPNNQSNENKIYDLKLAEAISSEVLKIEGVSSMEDAGITETISNTVNRREDSVKGVVISYDEEKLVVMLRLNVYFGINIPQISYVIQSRLKDFIEKNYNIIVKTINVSVEGIEKR